MAAQKFTRNVDYTDDESNNVTGRSTVLTASLDGEMDEIKVVTDDHADLLDAVLRADQYIEDDYLQGHEFSAAAIGVLSALLGMNTDFTHKGAYSATTAYAILNMAEDNGSTYLALTVQTSGQYANFAAALADGAWTMFAQQGTAALPSGATADDILYYTGSTEGWSKITAAMAPLHALLAAPAFTGVMSLVGVTTGKITKVSGTTISLDFDAGPNQEVNTLADADAVFSTTNRATASGEVKFIDMRIVCDGTTRTFSGSFPPWVWLTAIPTEIASGKTGLLSLRCYGTAETDVIAAWTVES